MKLCLKQSKLKKHQNQMTLEEKLVFLILILLTVEYVLHYYMEIGIVPKSKIYIYLFISIILPLIIMLGQKPKLNLYRMLFLTMIFCLIGVTFVYTIKDKSLLRTIVSVSIYIQMLSGFFITKYDTDFFEKVFVAIAYISFAGFAYVFITTNIDIELAMRRGYQWTEVFYYTSLFWAVIPFVILSVLTNKHIRLSLIYWMTAILLNLVIVKRIMLVDSILLIIIVSAIILLRKGRLKNLTKLLFCVGFIYLLSSYLIGDNMRVLFDSVYNRTIDITDSLSEFDRFVESANYLNSASILEIIIGKGFGGTHNGLGVTAEALHVGWGNFMLKGGLIFLLMILIPYIKVLFLARKVYKAPVKIQFSFWYLVIMFPRLFYLNMHSLDPSMLLFFYCIFNIMDCPYADIDDFIYDS